MVARLAPVLALALICGWPLFARGAQPVGEGGARSPRGLVLRGTDRLIGGEEPVRAPIPGGLVSLDLVEAPLTVAAKAVLADTLGWGYTLDERATGTITLQTGGPIAREALLQMFEAALASRGLSLRRSGRMVQIGPVGSAQEIRPVRAPGAEAGAVAVPLRWISAAEMQSILSSVAPREVVLRADRARNLLILSGDAAQIRTLRQTIAVFDVDWMRGMSTAMLPVRSANPAVLARDLTQIFGGETAGTGDVIRFIPNEALNAVLVVSSRAVYLDRARVLLERLETLAADRERQLFVYRIQNRSAKDLAAVLQGVVMTEMACAYGMGGMGGGFGAYGGGASAVSGGYAATSGFGGARSGAADSAARPDRRQAEPRAAETGPAEPRAEPPRRARAGPRAVPATQGLPVPAMAVGPEPGAACSPAPTAAPPAAVTREGSIRPTRPAAGCGGTRSASSPTTPTTAS